MMIKIGDSIRLEPSDGSARQYRSKALAVADGAVHISYPIDEQSGKTVYLLNGMQFKATFVGQDGGLYMFDTEVKGKIRDPLPMVVLAYPGEEYVVRIQRRRYVRVKANVDAAVHPSDSEFAPFVTMTVDISAGGAALLVPPAHAPLLRPGMAVELWLVLAMRSGEYHYVQTKASIVRMADDERGMAKMSVEFTMGEGWRQQNLNRTLMEHGAEPWRSSFGSCWRCAPANTITCKRRRRLCAWLMTNAAWRKCRWSSQTSPPQDRVRLIRYSFERQLEERKWENEQNK
nr:flagellar brake domain-containing protein [Geobacillus kaustophilus]